MKQKLHSILLIDDDDATNFINSFLLKQLDITEQITIKDNAAAALDFLQTGIQEMQIPDLIFLDINMPGMNGWEFLEQFQARFSTRKLHTVIVMLTTSANPDDAEKAATYPEIAAFKTKPLDKTKISEILRLHFPQLFREAV
ncbi:Response regulator receiver domain-containing protein [Filimonas lacunae]|uniref:Response regulator receiver domain-containing protein n=1 Tax=Filimonas lacunae TaxID=477680 RepID=A0A173MFW2_9BACT|nr:response regulator [Filimonas lacunae]BAV06370.1 two-component response regulator [Filimonas lacunae]SIT26664.1 Response regulator receiver domain-containing protein [Filimonas lacunae]